MVLYGLYRISSYSVNSVCSQLETHVFDFVFGTTGTIGHVAHGKSTVVKAISGVQVGIV